MSSVSSLPSAADLLIHSMMVRTAALELLPYALHEEMRVVLLRRPTGRNVQLRHAEGIKAHQIERARSSYIQALIIASRGALRHLPCERCVRGLGPFIGCYGLDVLREGACANCIWGDASTQCRYYRVYAIVRTIPPLTQQFSHVAIPLSSSASEPRTIETIVSLSSAEDNADVQLSRELAAAQVEEEEEMGREESVEL